MVYEMQVYFQWWISMLFRDFLWALKRSIMGLTTDEVLGLIDSDLFNHQIYKFLEKKDDYYGLKYGEFTSRVLEYNNSKTQLMEECIAYDDVDSISENCANMLMTLSLLYQKYLNIKEDKRFIKIRLHLSEDYWYKDIFELIDLMDDMQSIQVIKLLLNRFVIQKHDNAMYVKRDLRRCWFTKTGERYVYQADTNIEWRSAKHDKIYKFLFDMNLIDVKDSTFVVSTEGKELYKELKEKYYEE
jgi:hypothetical protein